MPPKPPERGVQSISSFFKPKPISQQQASRAIETLVLDSSDDDVDNEEPVQEARATKRIKLEHTDSSTPPVASTSKLSSTATRPLPPSSAPAPSTSTYKRLQGFSYTRPNPDDPPQPKKVLTESEQKRRDLFVKKLVGKLATREQRKSSYLENEHFMAPRGESDEEQGQDGEMSMLDEEGRDENGFDADEDGGETMTDGKKGKDVKGKGKAKDQDSASSGRFAKFARTTSSSSKKSSSKDSSPSASTTKYTPLEQQVVALKKANPGVLLAVEVGYKFKFFQEDAQTASKVLNIACFPQQHMLTASIPTHRLEIHTRRLLNAGHKVGIVRQLETAALKKVSDNRSKPFTRALTNLYTSATFVDELGVGDDSATGAGGGSRTATLMCLVEEKVGTGKGNERVRIGLVAAMPSTGEIVWDDFEDGLMRSELETRMLHLQPSELLLQKDLSPPTESILKHLAGQHNAGTPGFTCRIERIPKRPNSSKAISNITEFYAEIKEQRRKEMKKVPSEIVLGDSDDENGDEEMEKGPSTSQRTEIDENGEESTTQVFDLPKLVLIALSSLITHLSAFNLSSIFLHTSSFTSFSSRTSMTLNGNTITNLELLRNSTDFKEEGSLIWVLDKCKTAMGKRLLRKWVSKPLVSVEAVNCRLDAISEIHSASSNLALSKLRELLKSLPDLERGLSRIHFGRATPDELLRVLEALTKIGTVFDQLASEGGGGEHREFGLKSELLRETVRELPKIKGTVKGLVDQVNQKMARDGKKENLFEREQDWPELVECKKARDQVEEEIQDELKKARKILKKPALQFKQVSLEEYLLEVKVSEKNIVPADWLRINGTKTYYRFRSPPLQRKIQELEQARERLANAANAAYLSFLQEVASHYAPFRSTITHLATLDCLFSLALVALANNYVKPTITREEGKLEIKQGRHPIIEQVSSEPFVANDVEFGGLEGKRQMILTGLNMGGKSSLAKSVALIGLMAQIGSFVPAEAVTTSLFDGIYTRMGASDSIMQNRSTFMLELVETSEILKLATRRSLILLDELGRGTSTNDGESIAQAVLEWISKEKQSLTVFVTHYPNLSILVQKYPESITTNHMSCLEGDDDITFLYKLVPGLASSSHGLNVAKMAGIPESVLKTANEKRLELERIVKDRVDKRKKAKLAKVVKELERLRSTGEGGGRELLEMCKSLVE
ncbi:mismatch repair protein MSH3 [Sporobolomyces salmoneus]|uniref:mismatch repair protein MSH3 n=1 Tax=Sporobolomyces salmoneus TaxID=183962 RepID=UPI00317F9665